MKADPTELVDYFNGVKQNVIPLFQRRYDWEAKHWRRFWQDLRRCCESERQTSHFLGSVVSAPIAGPGVSKTLIIDGQQRLTTFALLLAAIRDTASDDLAGKIQDFLLNERYIEPDRLKLVPTQPDREAFRQVIEDGVADTSSQIGRGYSFLRRKVSAFAGGAPAKLESLYEHASNDLRVVWISLEAEDDPYLIFESLNDKGRRLTQADLIRNTALMRFGNDGSGKDEQSEIYSGLWMPIEAEVGQKRLADFFWHYTLMGGEDVRRNGAYWAVKEMLDGKQAAGGKSAVRGELKRLLRLAKVYSRFLVADGGGVAQRRDALRTFVGVRNTVAYPLLLALHDAAYEGKITEGDLTVAYQWIESFVVRRLVCGLKTNQLRGIFLPCCRKVAEAEPGGIMDALRRQLLMIKRGHRWPSDEDFVESVEADPQRDARTNRVVLERLERSLLHKEPASLKECTVEHVLPQTLTGKWRAALGEHPDELHAKCVHLLGNLTLTGYNSELSNSSFTVKKERLGDSRIGLNRWIASQETWGPEQIRARGKHLAASAVKIWLRPPETDLPKSLAGTALQCSGPLAAGRGEHAGGKKIVVLKGSLCRAKTVRSTGAKTLERRRELLESGIVEPTDTDQLRFTDDYTFPNPSSAAAFILGSAADGNKCWQDESGRTLRELSLLVGE